MQGVSVVGFLLCIGMVCSQGDPPMPAPEPDGPTFTSNPAPNSKYPNSYYPEHWRGGGCRDTQPIGPFVPFSCSFLGKTCQNDRFSPPPLRLVLPGKSWTRHCRE